MYNGVGLMSVRGSNTSGYVTKNWAMKTFCNIDCADAVAMRRYKVKSKVQFLQEMKAMQENALPAPRKANQDILKHRQTLEIYVKLEEIRRELTDKNLSE